ncbi:MAG: DUF3768 domain-containing protein [Pseudomonadota bacterium]
MKTPNTIRKIAELNDILRKTGTGGRIVTTSGIAALGNEAVSIIMNRIKAFDDFTPDNDPNHEHDFGVIIYDGGKCFWKIDYYDHHFENASADPANALITNRVLTVMLAEEY